MKMLSAFVGICILATAFAQGRSAYVCDVVLDNFCATGADNCNTDPALHYSPSSSTPFDRFNMISFGGFNCDHGDVEGRVAVRNNAVLSHYSTGYQLMTSGVAANSDSQPYTHVVGGDCSWDQGDIYPSGTGIPFPGDAEDIFVGGTFTASDDHLRSRRSGSCTTPGCLNNDFDYAQGYYNALSAGFAALPTNAAASVQFSGLTITCDSMADAQYVIQLTPAQVSGYTYSSVVNCNPNSALIINIVGAGTVTLAGNREDLGFSSQKTLYNVVPNGANTANVAVSVGVLGNLLAPSSVYSQSGGVFKGYVIAGDVQSMLQINLYTCSAHPSGNHNNSQGYDCPSFETECSGLDFTLSGSGFSFADFNVIVFGDFNADTGDVQGRLAAQGNCHFGNGYSVGDQLQTIGGNDRHLLYSLICGKDAAWGTGALFPVGNGIPYPGLQEDMFIGGTFTTNQTDLEARNHGPCTESPGCLDSIFNSAKDCYSSYSDTISSYEDNVQFEIAESALRITCNDASSPSYTISIDGSRFTEFTYTTVGNCNFQASWNINIRGDGDVEITGDSFPAIPGGTVYNVIGCGRTITIHDTTVQGAVLAPCSTINQYEGLINGKVVAGDVVASRQINRENTCAQDVEITVPIEIVQASLETAETGNDFLRIGDDVEGNTVIGIEEGNVYRFASRVTWSAGDVVYTQVSSVEGRTPSTPEKTETASASIVSMTLALIAVLIALAF